MTALETARRSGRLADHQNRLSTDFIARMAHLLERDQ